MSDVFPMIALGDLLIRSEERANIDPEEKYRQVTVKLWGKGVELREEVEGISIAASKMFVAKSQQFILSKIDARNGAFGLIPASLDGAVVSADFPVFTPDSSRLLPRFLDWMSKTPDFVNICAVASEGTTNRIRLRIDRFLSSEIPLPSLEEQRRIVARIEGLAAKIAEARGLRRETEEELRSLKNAFLNTLFSSQLANNWPDFHLDDIADIRAGVTLGRTLVEDVINVPYLRVANVQDGYLDLENVKTVNILSHELEKWELQAGDVLLTEGGDWDKLGRGAVWDEEIVNCIHQNHIFRIRVNSQVLNPNFLVALTGSPIGKAYFQTAAKQTTNLASINQKQLRAFKVICPPLEEQRRIVAHLDALQARVDTLKRIQAESSAELNALLPSILDKAFKGEL